MVRTRAVVLTLPVKYHVKWPLKRASVFQEPFPAALSPLTVLVHFNGSLSFFLLLSYELPLRPETYATYYEYTGLWQIYGPRGRMNSWFWSVYILLGSSSTK